LNTKQDSEVDQHATGVQGQLLVRMLVGAVNEGWRLVERHWPQEATFEVPREQVASFPEETDHVGLSQVEAQRADGAPDLIEGEQLAVRPVWMHVVG